MTKKDKATFLVSFIFILISWFVLALLVDDRIIQSSTFAAILIIELLLFVPYGVYLMCKHHAVTKKAKASKMSRYGASMTATLKHISGLPLTKGAFVEVFYCPDKIVFKKAGQEIVVSRDKITDIELVSTSSRTKAMAGAAFGKRLYGGTAGATLGALAATTPNLVISYTSGKTVKRIKLDTYTSGMFATNVQKDFRKTQKPAPSSIEL